MIYHGRPTSCAFTPYQVSRNETLLDLKHGGQDWQVLEETAHFVRCEKQKGNDVIMLPSDTISMSLKYTASIEIVPAAFRVDGSPVALRYTVSTTLR